MKNKYFLVLLFAVNLPLYAEPQLCWGTKLQIPSLKTYLASNTEKYNFGLHFSSDYFYSKIPLEVKLGNLSSGGSISKMNSPLLSGAGSPFSPGTTSVSGITATLPGISTYSKPVSSFYQISYKNKKTPVTNAYINCWYSDEDSITAASTYINSSFFKKKLNLQSSFTAGSFPYSENNSSYWILKSPYYKSGKHLVTSFSTSASFWKLYLMLSVFSYESPFGKIQNTYKTDIKYSGQHFSYALSSAINPNNSILTSSDQTIKQIFQLHSNLQYKDTIFIKRPLFYKTGFSSFLSNDGTQNQQNIKISCGIQFTYWITTLSVVNYSNGLYELGDNNAKLTFESGSYSITNSWSFPVIHTSLSFADSYKPESNFSSIINKYSVKISASYNKIPKVNSSISYSFTEKDAAISKQKITMGIQIELNYKYITGTIKLNSSFNI